MICSKHNTPFVHNLCPRCLHEQENAIGKIHSVERVIKKLPEYAEVGAYALAYKTYEIFKRSLTRRRPAQ